MSQELLPRPMVIEEFTPLVGKLFRVDCAPRNVDITLVEATPDIDRGITPRPPFTLIFHSDAKVRLMTGIYTVRSGSFGPDMIYLEETSAQHGGPPGIYYQAVFN